VRGDRQRLPHVLRVEPLAAVEVVDGDDVRQPAALEVVERGEAVLEAAGVGQDDGADRAAHQVVPHEPEPLLARRTEQVEHQVVVERERP
jgi:hypothetical protein